MRSIVLAAAISLIPMSMFAAKPKWGGSDPVLSLPLSEPFTLQDKTAVPGKTLKPGRYTITVVDHLSDRVILRVADQDGKVQTTFLGLYNTALKGTAPGPVQWGNTSKDGNALRGFMFPGSRTVEFVYPKGEAVAIAKQNADKVLAIDPASDNLHLKHDQLSPEDMRVVTLWSLDSTRVGPNDEPAIEAVRYQAPVPASRPMTVAAGTQLAAPSYSAAPHVRNLVPVQRTQIASNAHLPLIGALPHTADNLTEPLIVSLLAFLGFGLLRVRRTIAKVS